MERRAQGGPPPRGARLPGPRAAGRARGVLAADRPPRSLEQAGGPPPGSAAAGRPLAQLHGAPERPAMRPHHPVSGIEANVLQDLTKAFLRALYFYLVS